MYEEYFELKRKPFGLNPDHEFLYLSQRHSLALSMLRYGILEPTAGFVVITGEIGSGKTTLVRRILDEVSDDVVIAFITNTHQSLDNLLQWVLLSLGLDYKGKDSIESYQILSDFLIEQYSKNNRTVIIIDEAQNLPPPLLEELRLISNLNSDQDHIVQLVLVGQPELRETLKRTELKQFAQRVFVDYHLPPLASGEVEKFIQHRLAVAGRERALFTKETCDLIYEYTGGVPRLINIICENCLVYAFAESRKRITPDIAWEVIQDKLETGLLPLNTSAREKHEQNHGVVSLSDLGSRDDASDESASPENALTDLHKQIDEIKQKIFRARG